MVRMARETEKKMEEAKDVARVSTWKGALDALDAAAKRIASAELRAEAARENFSAKILAAVVSAPSAVALLEGITERRSLHAAESGAYAQLSVALMRVKRGMKRVSGSEKVEDWSANFEAIRAAASEAPNFTQFERGAPSEAIVTPSEASEAAITSRAAATPARERVAMLPEPPREIEDVQPIEWPEAARGRLQMFDRLVGACVLDGWMTQAYADAIVALAREGIIVAIRSPEVSPFASAAVN